MAASRYKKFKNGNLILNHEMWYFGRFADRYQRVFGELPSITIGSARKGS